MANDVSIVIPVWNGRELLQDLIAGIHGQTLAVHEILVIDNGSTDGAPEMAERCGARVIRLGANMGFSRAVNRGIQESQAEWIAVLNSDVELATDWLERLLAGAQQSGAWFATGKILSASDRATIDATYDAICLGACAWRVGSGRPDGPVFSQPQDMWFAPWTAAVFRAELFRKVGLLDEMFESYLEDVEFGLRCAYSNHPGRYVPGAMAYHVGSSSLGKWHPETVRRISRNQVFLLAKYYPPALLFRLAWPICISHALWGLVAMSHGTFGSFLRGKVEGLKLWRTARRGGPDLDGDRILKILSASEDDISRVQKSTGFDWYWRLYFSL